MLDNLEDSIRKIYPLTTKKKKLISAKIRDNKNSIFNEDYLKNTLPVINNLDEIDLTKLLTMDNDTYKKCLFLEKHFCWISSNDKGKQRYFTKGHLTYSLDICDLLTIYFNCTYNELFNLVSDLGFSDNSWRSREVKKHIENMENINSILEENENASKLIKKKIDIYIALNDFASKNSLSFERHNSNSIFFISTRYLKEKYNLPYSISTINQTINLYALLGLLYKVPENKIENPIYSTYSKVKTNRAPIAFYSIFPINNFVNDLYNKSEILVKNNISYYNIDKNLSENLQKTYNVSNVEYNLNLGGGNKTKKAKNSCEIKRKIEYLFENLLNSSEIVAKEWIKDNLVDIISDTAFDKKWKELVKSKKGKCVKPTKVMKEKYNLKTNQEIFIREEI